MKIATAIKERPILFSAPMVRAILAGRKTMTRRVVKPQPTDRDSIIRRGDELFVGSLRDSENAWLPLRYPYGRPGDHLWVRETWSSMPGCRPIPNSEKYDSKPAWYRADNDRPMWAGSKWRPSIFMPREYSRITLEITDVRVERLQEISHQDALSEGVSYDVSKEDGSPLARFRQLWDKLNASRGYGWDANPFVWVMSFKRLSGGGL